MWHSLWNSEVFIFIIFKETVLILYTFHVLFTRWSTVEMHTAKKKRPAFDARMLSVAASVDYYRRIDVSRCVCAPCILAVTLQRLTFGNLQEEEDSLLFMMTKTTFNACRTGLHRHTCTGCALWLSSGVHDTGVHTHQYPSE